MIKFIICKNTTKYNIAGGNIGYFIHTIDTEGSVFDKFAINIRRYLDVDYDDFDEILKTYNGKSEYFGNVFVAVVQFFINKEDAERFIKEYLEPQLIAKELSN